MIQYAEASDIPQILEIVNHYILNDTCIYDIEPRALAVQEAWFEQQQQLGNPVFVAKENGKVLGYASYGQYRPKVGYKFSMEHSVYIRPDRINKGLGKALMEALIDHARQKQIHVLIGGIDANNQSSIDFHTSLGFELVGRMNQVGYKFDRWLDLVWMQKIL